VFYLLTLLLKQRNYPYTKTLAVIKKMKQEIDYINRTEYKEVVDLWEASVRATHHFLQEEDIEYFKPLILNTYLDAVELRCIRTNSEKIVGFLGVAEHNLEMLFIHPDYRGRRIGKTLLDYSISKLKVTKVDVNEQNEQAVGFYKHCGFETINRSELDSSGTPYPTLQKVLKK
jgi:putative acetyltransferase